MKPILILSALSLSCSAIAQPCNDVLIASYMPSTVCAGRPLQLNASLISGASYSWGGPMGVSSGSQNFSINPVTALMSGDYIVTATVGSCIYKDTVSIQVHLTPAAPTLPAIGCEGDTLFTGIAGNPGYIIWNPNNNVVSAPIPNASSAHNGQYRIVAISPAGCVSDTTSNAITVLPYTVPAVNVGIPPDKGPFTPFTFTVSVPNGGASPQYQWRKNGIDIPGAIYTTYTAVLGIDLIQGDEVSVWVKVDATCPGEFVAGPFVINIDLGMNDLTADETTRLYPNPNNGRFTLDITDSYLEGSILEVINTVGQVVYKENVRPRNKLDVDLRGFLADGVYLLKLHGDGKTIHARFIVKH